MSQQTCCMSQTTMPRLQCTHSACASDVHSVCLFTHSLFRSLLATSQRYKAKTLKSCLSFNEKMNVDMKTGFSSLIILTQTGFSGLITLIQTGFLSNHPHTNRVLKSYHPHTNRVLQSHPLTQTGFSGLITLIQTGFSSHHPHTNRVLKSHHVVYVVSSPSHKQGSPVLLPQTIRALQSYYLTQTGFSSLIIFTQTWFSSLITLTQTRH